MSHGSDHLRRAQGWCTPLSHMQGIPMTNTNISTGARISDAAGHALDATTAALNTGRQVATEAAGRIGEIAREVSGSAADLARRGAVSDASLAAQRRLGDYARATKGYVARDPWTAALVATAIGVAVGVLAMSVLRQRDRN